MELSTVVQIVGIACVVIMIINTVRYVERSRYSTGFLQDNIGDSIGWSSMDLDVIVSALGAAALGGYFAVTNASLGSIARRGLTLN